MITTLVFDWGDTLMPVDPQAAGPMYALPEVAAVPGVKEAIQQLHGHFNLVVATNAQYSSSAQVRLALDRVEIGSFFTAVFTPAETSARKPQPAFFQAVQSVLGLQPDQLCMIGDSYADDILGAHQAGWTAAWYNPSGTAAPGLLPLQDLEVAHLGRLPEALASRDYPGYAACLALLQAQQAPANLLAHVHGVASVAYRIAIWLRAAGHPVDPLLAHRGGLLHDLAKLRESREGVGPSHGELAARILMQAGYPLLAETARRHMLFSLVEPDSHPQTWEQKLVYFADKIIEAGRIASLEERITALSRRYPQDADEIKNILPALVALQEEICAAAGIPPSDLIPRLRSAFSGR